MLFKTLGSAEFPEQSSPSIASSPSYQQMRDSLKLRLYMHRKGSYQRRKEPMGWRTSSPAVRQTRGLYPEFTKNCKSCTQRKCNCPSVSELTAVMFFKRRNADDQFLK